MKSKFSNLLFYKKPKEILLLLLKKEERFSFKISKEVDSPYAYVSLILNEFEKNRLIKYKKKGRRKIINLTAKGTKLALAIQKIMEIM